MSLGRAATAVLAAAATVFAAGVVTAAPAVADSKDCPNGYVCVWENANFTGTMFHRTGAPSGIRYYFDGWNDKASSLVNKSGADICWYEGADPRTGAVWGRHDHPSYYLDAYQMQPNDSMTAIGVCV